MDNHYQYTIDEAPGDALEAHEGEPQDLQTYMVIGAAMAVHSELGHGFLEPVYQEAMAVELERRAIPFEREVPLPVYYAGQRLKVGYRVDFLCFGELLVELKALRGISSVEEGQVLNYLKASRLSRALLLNFGEPSLHMRRFIWIHSNSTPQKSV